MNQEKVAVNLLSAMMYVWCERDDTEHVEFNCGICEFQRDDGMCWAKMFINEHRRKHEKIKNQYGVWDYKEPLPEPYKEGE